MGMPSCGQRLLRWQQMTLWFKSQARINLSRNCVTNVWAKGLPVFIAVWRLQKNIEYSSSKTKLELLEYSRANRVLGTALYLHLNHSLTNELISVQSGSVPSAYKSGYIKQLIGHVAFTLRRRHESWYITLCVSVHGAYSLNNLRLG